MSEYGDDDDPPLISASVIQAILASKKPKLEIDGNRAIIDEHVDKFRQEMGSWKLNRLDLKSPPLSRELQEILIKGFYALVEGFDRAGMIPQDKRQYVGITKDAPGMLLQTDISLSDSMKNYEGNQEEATYRLVGSVITRAVDAAVDIGIIDASVRYKHFS